MTLSIGSLFSGIGGLELGLEWAGLGPVVWQVEQNAYCRAVLAKHWPNATRHDDVCTVGAETLPPVDVICGGFPCQDISVAGKGAGIGGARSGLWAESARIVRDLRPRYVVVENVPALLGRGLGRVLGDLAEIGYDAEWECIAASDVGAPHRRDRLFVLAYPNGAGLRQQPVGFARQSRAALADVDGAPQCLADANSIVRHEWWSNHAPQVTRGWNTDRGGVRTVGVAHADRLRELQPQGGQCEQRRRPGDRSWWAIEPDVGRVAHGVPARVDRLSALGNAVVPQVAEVAGQRIITMERAV